MCVLCIPQLALQPAGFGGPVTRETACFDVINITPTQNLAQHFCDYCHKIVRSVYSKSSFTRRLMKLREYLKLNNLTISAFADQIEYSRPHLSRVLTGKLKLGKKLARDIEKATNGQVKAHEIV